jgi:hypothetical protein
MATAPFVEARLLRRGQEGRMDVRLRTHARDAERPSAFTRWDQTISSSCAGILAI